MDIFFASSIVLAICLTDPCTSGCAMSVEQAGVPEEIPWEQRIRWEEVEHRGKRIAVLEM